MNQTNAPIPQSQSADCTDSNCSAGSAQTELVACPAVSVAGTQEHVSAHPCLTSNNSIHAINKGIAGYTDEEKTKEYEFYRDKIDKVLTGYHRKGQKRMQFIIEQAALRYGRNALGVIDLTFGDSPDGEQPSFDYANRCLNSILTNIFRKRYSVNEGGRNYNNFLVVCERGGKRGRIHFHVLVVKEGADFRTGSFKGKQNGRPTVHPNETCRQEWQYLRKHVEAYGFGGHVRVQPLWDVEKGARYFTKYVGKGHYHRNEEMKGRQLIRYGSGFSRWHSMKFSHVHGASRDRRFVLETLGSRYGCSDLSELNELFGSRWQYYAGDQMRFMGALARGRLLPPQTITWLGDYLWNAFKMKLIKVQRQPFRWEVVGAYKYMIKESEARKWVSRSVEAPDDVYEKVGLYVAENLRQYAMRNLCAKIEADYMGDELFKPLPIIDGLYNLKQDEKNETEQQKNEQIGGDSGASLEPIGQLEINGGFY